MDKIAPSYDYKTTAEILGYSLRTIQQLVYERNKPYQKIKLDKVQGDGMLPRITHESVVRAYAAQHGIEVKEAESYVRKKLEGGESQDAGDNNATDSSIVVSASGGSDGDSGVEVESTPVAVEPEQSYIYSVPPVVDGNERKKKKKVTAPKADKNGISSRATWMYTFPFNDPNPEFGVLPEEFLSWSTPDDPTRRLDFIADKFFEDPQVESLLAAYCRSKDGYPHFHVVVKFNDSYKISIVFHKPGNHPNVLAVQKTQLLPDGSRVQHKAPTQGIIDYIMAEGQFEGKKNEECIKWTTRGDSLFREAEAEKKAAEETKTEQLMNEVKAGKTRMDILAQHPYLNTPNGIEKIRTAQEYVRWEKMGRPEKRNVRVLLVLGDIRTGKTRSVYETLREKGFMAATLSEQNGLEAYEAQPTLIIDHPNERWCPYDLLIKMLSSNIVTIPVRTQGAVKTLWNSVVIEAESISELLLGYCPERHSPDWTGPTNPENLLKYIDKIRYCFHVETRKLGPTLFQDGYAAEAVDGVNTRLDYLDIPVSRGVFRVRYNDDKTVDDELIRQLARLYFDVTKIQDEKAPALDVVKKTAEMTAMTNDVFHILRDEWVEFNRDDVLRVYKQVCEKRSGRQQPKLPGGRVPADGPDL